MMRGSSPLGRWGLLVGILACVVSSSGWAAWAPKKASDEARLQATEALKEEYLHFYSTGQYPEAAEAARRACSILEEEHGKSSMELARCLNDLGVLLYSQGEYGRAEPLYERALTITEKALGPDHPSVATSLNNLAGLYHYQGDYGKAKPLYERALAIKEKALGPDHPSVATSLNNLAGLYREQGDYGKAELLYEQALATFEKVLGPSHPDIATNLNNLAQLYVNRGDHRKAEPLLKRALAIMEKALGPDHPNVAGSLNNLAQLYVNRGDYGKAKPLYERALAIIEKALGPDHPHVAKSLNNLAGLYREQGDYGQVEPLYERALAIMEKALGPDHPDFATSLNNLAGLHRAQGNYGNAEPIYEQALAIREKALGPDHPHVAQSLNNLALLYHYQGDYWKAQPLYERALAIIEKALGPDHPDVAASLNNLALLYQYEGDYGKAQRLYERALAIIEKALGPDHPDAAQSLHNLAMLYDARGDYENAEPLYEQALAIREKALGPDHPDVAASLNNLALLYQYDGDYGKAQRPYERALAIREKTLGPDHPDVAQSLNNLATLHQYEGDYGKAQPLYERALAIWEKALGPEHPDVAHSLSNLASLYDDQSSFELALPLHRRALDIEETNLVRTLTVASESRKLAFASTLSGSLHHALSRHLRVAPEHNAVAELALTTILRRKNRVQDLVSQSNATLRRSLPHDDLHLLDDLSDVDSRIAMLFSHGPGPRGVEAHSQQLDELDEQRDRLWSELAKHSALVEALEHPITIEDVQKTLPSDSALIEYVQYVPLHDEAGTRLRRQDPKPPPHYAAYLVFPDRDFAWVDLGRAALIDEHVETFRKVLQTKQAIPTALYDAVMRPVAAKLGSTRRLVLAPAGILNLIPFGALFDGRHYLVEQYDLHYVTTGRDLLPSPAVPPVAITPVTIVASPTGDEVPGAELEADVLVGFFPKAHVLRGDEATETNVRAIERPLVLHLATHGFFGVARNERDNPMFRSGLNLADITQVEVDPDLDDGQLTAYEVSGMDLRGTQLVVLSACGTGLGEVDSSEGVFGLRRAFATADARTTVMSLWEVSGTTTQRLMEAYYLKLAEGMGRGEAMQAVQLEMLRSEEHRHPKDWAAFIVSGDDSPVVFPEGEEPRVPGAGPPEIEPGDKKGLRCAIGKSSDKLGSNLMVLMGLLGLVVIPRRVR